MVPVFQIMIPCKGWAQSLVPRMGNRSPIFMVSTDGIFQNVSEVQSYAHTDAAGKTALIQPNAVPGDVRFVDLNGDGKIDDSDRTKIGNGTHNWVFGMNFNAKWKGLDFSMMWQGTIGNDIMDVTRRVDITHSNLPSYMLNRWTGEGT